jgi:hypothetical protein
MTSGVRGLLARSLCAAWMLAGAGIAGAQGVHVAIIPAVSQVEPGAVFDLELRVTEAGSAFNGFDAVIGYDPAALTLIPLSPTSQQQGTLMTGACGNTFHRFTPGSGSVSIASVLLCSGVSVTGPGQIYRLRFQASTTAQHTAVQFLPGLQFYNAGLFVNPAISSNAVVTIGTPTNAVDPPLGAGTLALRVSPNPARGQVAFAIEADRTGPLRLSIVDVRGRVVRRFEDTLSTPATTVRWNGRDTAGRLVPAGVYLVTLEAGGRSISTRVSLVR